MLSAFPKPCNNTDIFKKANIFILCYDIRDEEAVNKIEKQKDELQELRNENENNQKN